MDLDSPVRVVAALYALLSGPRGTRRDWSAVRALFMPDAQLHSELILPDASVQSRSWTVDAFATEAAAEYAKADGFWETEIARKSEQFGDIAHVWSTYEARVISLDAPPVIRGINSVQLLRRGGRWWIAGLVFQIERPPAAPIPAKYLVAKTPGPT